MIFCSILFCAQGLDELSCPVDASGTPTPRFGLSPSLPLSLSLHQRERKEAAVNQSVIRKEIGFLTRPKRGMGTGQGLPSVHSAYIVLFIRQAGIHSNGRDTEIYRIKGSKQKNPGIKPFNVIMVGNASNKYGLGKLRLDEGVPVRLSELTQGEHYSRLGQSEHAKGTDKVAPRLCFSPRRPKSGNGHQDSCAKCSGLLHLLDPSWLPYYLTTLLP
jgi:hypothetical protein